jgi:hypothetical protein
VGGEEGEGEEDRAKLCAGWFLDHVRDTAQDDNMHVAVLEGGVEGWVRSGPRFVALMDGYDGKVWERWLVEQKKKEEGGGKDVETLEQKVMSNDDGRVSKKRKTSDGDPVEEAITGSTDDQNLHK